MNPSSVAAETVTSWEKSPFKGLYAKRDWRYLLRCTALWGLNMRKKECRCYTVTVFIIIALYAALQFFLSFFLESSTLPENVSVIGLRLQPVTTLLSLIYINRHKDRIHAAMKSLFTIQSLTVFGERKSIVLNMILVFLFGFLPPAILSVKYRLVDNKSTTDIIVFFIACIVHLHLAFIPLCLLTILIILICKEFESAFIELKKKTENVKIPTKCDLFSVTNLYTKIWKIINCLDDILSPLAFLWCASLVVQIVSNVTELMNGSGSDFIYTIVALSNTFFQFYLFCYYCVSCAKMSESSSSLCFCVYEKFLDCDDNFLRISALTFSSKCANEPPSFTVWKMFSINRGLILTIASAISTYMLFMYEQT